MNRFHLRPTAVPLVVNDPFFSLWSFSDCLTDDVTRHWTGREQSIFGALFVDGVPFRFLGKAGSGMTYFPEPAALRQISRKVTPTASIYTFSHPACTLRVTFLSPLLADRLDVLSRPVSYVFYEITPKEEGHTFEVYFDATATLCGDDCGNLSCFAEKGHAWMGATEQRVLNSSGDDHRIDWGYLHLVHPNAKCGIIYHRNSMFLGRVSARRSAFDPSAPVPMRRMPILSARSEKLSDVFVLAYDDVKSIDYFHTPADAYYKKFDKTFDAMLKKAVAEAGTLRAECAKFDRKLTARMKKISPEYAAVGALAYRQTIAAHKLIVVNGEPLFLSKECFSNGCINTLDVTYPSIPLFLDLNPELVRAMMRPILFYSRSEEWRFPYAPHDCGRYPLCNGQVYSTDENRNLTEDAQMPVEECGNAILCVAAAAVADGDRTLADKNRDLLTRWADYLVEFGYDPGMQLCTDDFAGHLAHNCNLSVKAIVALGAFAKLFDLPEYHRVAKEMADRWTKEAKRTDGEGYRLTFDRDDTWSMKYNIVWDRLLGLGLFDPSVSEAEIGFYKKQMKRYGVPLDSRSDYTKLDWMEWTTVMTDDREYTLAVNRAIAAMISESADRVPITDWYYASTARQVSFQARSVLGGFYINLLLN